MHFGGKSVYLGGKSVYLGGKSVYFGGKSVHFCTYIMDGLTSAKVYPAGFKYLFQYNMKTPKITKTPFRNCKQIPLKVYNINI